MLSDTLGGDEATVNDALATPTYWSAYPDPTRARLCKVSPKTVGSAIAYSTSKPAPLTSVRQEEYKRVIGAFNATGGSSARVLSLQRIENLALWQSYAAKKEAMVMRAAHENLPSNEYERPMLFHATAAHVVQQIIEQGLNRSFCGRNGTVWGQGVYFACNASYSMAPTYSPPDGKGTKRMFICRVLAGESCAGHSGARVPDERVSATHQLYDTTVNTLDNPAMFVTYHDAQAYPEYLLEFTT